MKQLKNHRLMKCVLALALVICMAFTVAAPAFATGDEVRSVADGVMYFGITVNENFYGSGSCFLINEDTIITANHCVHFSKALYDYYRTVYGISKKEVDKNFEFTVTIARDFTIPAKLVNSSENMDFAILKLSQPLTNRTFLKLRDSKTVQAAETAYAVGFPGAKDSDTNTARYYNQKDIAFESGTINRTQYTEEFYMDSEQYYHFVGDVLMLTAGTSTGGNSGGPLVDENGSVIGVVSAGQSIRLADGGEIPYGACYCSAISQVMEVLDALGITYYNAGDIVVDPGTDDTAEVDYSALKASINTAESKEAKAYTEESYKKMTDALEAAKKALNATTQDEVDTAKKDLDSAVSALQEKSNNGVLIGIIAGAAVVIALVVVLIIVLSKKKSAAAPEKVTAAGGFTPPASPAQPSVPASVQAPGSEGTTVLSSNASDPNATTVLSGNASVAYLVRLSNNERINITKPYFKLGKDASRVDYCITGNPAVSRFHASIVSKNGQFFIVDNSTTNHTYVNDSMIPANVETQISNGAKIRFADEKFEFKF